MMKKRMVSLLLVFALLLTMAGCGSSKNTSESTATENTAQAPVVDSNLEAGSGWEPAESFSGGTGTESDPYQIANAEELAKLAEITSYDFYSQQYEEWKKFDGAYFVLTADISLNDTADFANWGQKAPAHQWTPIGGRDFAGHLDGQGHIISGMYIYDPSGEQSVNGLFRELSSGASVKNLTIENSWIICGKYGSNAGLLAGRTWGQTDTVTVTNVKANGVVESSEDATSFIAGGIVGFAHGDSIISGCAFTGTVCSAGRCGGIAGNANCTAITDCIAAGEADGACAGGIVGDLSPWKNVTTVENCISEMNVLASGMESMAGGIAGYVCLQQWSNMINFETTKGDGDILITSCENHFTVGNGENDYGGGIVGSVGCFNSGVSNLTVADCVNTGEITAATYGGGIIADVGTGPEGGVTVKDSTNEGEIHCGGYAGGVLGYHIPGLVSCVITDCQNTGFVEGGVSAGGMTGGVFLFTTLIDEKNMAPLCIEKCENDGKVRTVSGISGAGGIVGNIFGLTPGVHALTVDSCVNTGILAGLGAGRVGGILGTAALILLPEDGATDIPVYSISNCANTGDLCILEEEATDLPQTATADDTQSLTTTAEAELSDEEVGVNGAMAILGSSSLGGIVGYHKYGTIADCVFSGNIVTLSGMTTVDGLESASELAQNPDGEGAGIVTGGGVCGTYFYLNTNGSTTKNTSAVNCVYNEVVGVAITSFFENEGTVSGLNGVSAQAAQAKADEILALLK